MTHYTKALCWLWVQLGAMLIAGFAYPTAVLMKVHNVPYMKSGILVLNLLMIVLAVVALVKRHLSIAESRKDIPEEEEG